MTHRYRLRLFGPVELERADMPPPAIDSRKGWALLAYLARHAQPVARQQLADLFWHEAREGRGRRNLSRELSEIAAHCPGCFEADYHTVRWATQHGWVDTATFEALVSDPPHATVARPASAHVDAWFASYARPDAPPNALAEAVALCRGEFMAGFYLDGCPEFELWLVGERELWRRRVARALEQLIGYYALEGQFEQAQHYARRWIAWEPWQEEAHRALMVLLAGSGKRSDALLQYDACRHALASELGVEPLDVTTALYEQIRAGTLAVAPQAHLADAPPRGQVVPPLRDGSAAPEVGHFYGRERELATLEAWLVAQRCRLVAVAGMGGMGKTLLAAQVARQQAHHFDAVLWRSLLNAPPFVSEVREWAALLTQQQLVDLPEQPDAQIQLLMRLLAEQRCLLVLDNYESILQAEAHAGMYRPGYQLYGQLLQRVAETAHASCVLVTSREQPQGFALLQTAHPQVQSLPLAGLTTDAGQVLLRARGLTVPSESTVRLIDAYSGSPLALILVAETIQSMLGNDIDAFFHDEAPIFDDIRAVLDQQWGRLTALEQDIVLWLAIEREPVAPDALRANLHGGETLRPILEALRSLQRRSLLEQQEGGCTLQNVFMEYATDRLIEQVCAEVVAGSWERFRSHALIKAQAKEYVRESQVRLILEPIAARLVARLGRDGLARALRDGLARGREGDQRASGYAAGNALNLLLHLHYDVRGFDFSHLCVWQAHLRGARLPAISFAHADLSGSVFTDTFQAVEPVAWSPDGALLAAGTGAGEIRLWRVADWQIVGVCAGHTGIVWSIAFSPDGARLVSGGADATVRVWNVDTRQAAHVLCGHTQAVASVCFSPDGASVASASLDHTVRLWDVRSGAPGALLQGHTATVSCIAFSPDGAFLASSSADWSVRVWDMRSGAVVRVIEHPAEVRAVSWSPDGRVLASGGADYTVRLWEARSGQLLHTLCRHTDALRSLAFNPDGTILASSGDRLVWLWDTSTGQAMRALHGHTGLVVSVAWNPDGARLSSRGDETIRIWEAHTGQLLTTLHGHSAIVFAATWSPDGTMLASGHFDGAILLWDASTGELCHTLPGHAESTTALRFSPDGKLLASTGLDSVIRLWDLRTGQTAYTLRGHTKGCQELAWSPDGAQLASASYDHTVRVWDVYTGRQLHALNEHKTLVFAVAWSPDGAVLASGDMDGNLHLWDARTGQLQRTTRQTGSAIETLAWSPDAALLASGGSDRLVWIWLATGERALCWLEGHDEQVCKIAWSPDGSALASASLDATVRLWDVRSGQTLHTLRGHTSWVFWVAWSPDSRRVVSGSHDGTIRLWDVRTGECLRVLQAPGPYAGMDITGATGITEAQRSALRALGATADGGWAPASLVQAAERAE